MKKKWAGRIASVALLAAVSLSMNAGTPANPASPGGTKLATITDPVLNMPAYSITIPSNWIFEGAVFPGTRDRKSVV